MISTVFLRHATQRLAELGSMSVPELVVRSTIPSSGRRLTYRSLHTGRGAQEAQERTPLKQTPAVDEQVVVGGAGERRSNCPRSLHKYSVDLPLEM